MKKMKRKTVNVTLETVEFKPGDWSKGPHIRIVVEGSAYQNGVPMRTVNINVPDEYAALALLRSARLALELYRKRIRSQWQMCEDELKWTS